jgi:hypothetical protein
MNMAPEPENQKIKVSPFCPRCDWYKGLDQLKCPHCGFSEETGQIEKTVEEKTKPAPEVAARVSVKKTHLPSIPVGWVLLILVIGASIAYTGLREGRKEVALEPEFDLEIPPEIVEKPISTPQSPLFETPEELAEPEKVQVEEGISGKWIVSYGNLSTFPDLQFVGEAEFTEAGTYRIETHPREFEVSEGEIVFNGVFRLDGLELKGSGRSTIYQRGGVFGSQASDDITGLLDPQGSLITGKIVSTSSFHSGTGEEAIFEFELERGNKSQGSASDVHGSTFH